MVKKEEDFPGDDDLGLDDVDEGLTDEELEEQEAKPTPVQKVRPMQRPMAQKLPVPARAQPIQQPVQKVADEYVPFRQIERTGLVNPNTKDVIEGDILVILARMMTEIIALRRAITG